LRGAAGAAFALPLLNDVFRSDAHAADAGAAAAFPKRLFVFFTPNGTIPTEFFGPGNTTKLTLGQITAPLAPHVNDLLILDGLDNKVSMAASGDPHGVGIGCLLSGCKLLTGALAQGMSSGGWSAGISVDQYVANAVGKTTKLGSLQLAGKLLVSSIFSRMSFSGPGQPLDPYANPQQAFDSIFTTATTDAASQRRLALKKSILDEVGGQLDGLATTLSGADQRKVQAHAAYIRDIESRLLINVSGSCQPPPRPTVSASAPVTSSPYDPKNAGHEVINAAGDVDLPKIVQAHLDLVAGAFACDITRVASLMAAPSRSDVVMTWLPGAAGVGTPLSSAHHEMSHMSDAAGAPGLIQVNSWYATQLANFITKLKSIPEGTGTLFDNTVILWCNELGIGNIHSHTRVPFLLAGSCGGYFKTGRYVQFPAGTPHNNLLASIALAMGVPLTNNSFGDPAFCTGPLPGLT
jgi:hypothetical protein